MLRPTAIEVKPLPGYKLQIVFDNSTVGIFDVTPYIKGQWYGELADLKYFNRVATDGFTVIWPDGQDICPDELYENSIKITSD